MISDDPRDKLQAALNHDLADINKDLPAEYLAACRKWYGAMASSDKAMVDVARITFDKGDEKSAELIAVVLPSAPKYPLS